MTEFLKICEQAARIGGRQLLACVDDYALREKGPNDFVTDADLASQRAIQRFLYQHFPDHRFQGEEELESSSHQNSDSPFCWIVDPLDGTLNYIHGLQSYSVSVALRHGEQIIAGAVFDPLLNEMYSASRDGTATLNDRPIVASQCRELDKALVVFSLPANVNSKHREIDQLLELIFHSQSVRRLGSAALNLCYVAAGRLDAYWATSVRIWDIAAGWLILERAGGVLTSETGDPVDQQAPRLIAASTPSLNRELQAVLNKRAD